MEENKNDSPVLDKDVFQYLLKHAPEFLQSYRVLAGFYEHMTNNFTHKVWKDGRIVLTPKPQSNEETHEIV